MGSQQQAQWLARPAHIGISQMSGTVNSEIVPPASGILLLAPDFKLVANVYVIKCRNRVNS